MGKSARLVGMEIGKTAREMNALLQEHGYLEGSPGDYSLTEKGKKYGSEEHHHRGVGGYSHYNPNWTTRTWDEGIVAALAADMVADHPVINASTEPVGEREQGEEIVVAPWPVAYGTEESEAEPPTWVAVALLTGVVVVVVATNPRVHRWVGKNVTPRARKVWRTLTERGPVGAAADHDDDDNAPSDVVGPAEATTKDEIPRA